MEFKTKFNLEEDVYIVQNGIPYRCYVASVIIECNLRDFIIKYEVEKFSKDGELSDEYITIDENHVFADRDCTEIQIEQALQLRNGRLD